MDKDPIQQNINGVQSLVGSKLNKVNSGASGSSEGVDGEFFDALSLKLDDAELLALADKWTLNYAPYEAKIKLRQQANKTYYLGRQKEGSSQTTEAPISANLIFEAEETFLPAALSKNPEPVVFADNTPEGNKLSDAVKTMLQYHADTLVLRRQLTIATRHWSIYFIGVLKHGWDDSIEDIKLEVRDPQNFIFDPNGFVDAYADYVGPLGERITVPAYKLIEMFPKHKAYITIMVTGKLGTDVTYTEWWNDDYCFYTFKGRVLEKNKNPHFNYAKDVPGIDELGQTQIDEAGQPVMTKQKGNNHFAKPKKPYTFLTVFSLGEQPHDITGLIEQNIPNQRMVTRRTEQIDYNLSRQNNSDVFSETNFNQETAKQAATAMAKGHPILVPAGGPIDQAIVRLEAHGLDSSFFNDLENTKTTLRGIFGTDGLGATPPQEQKTLGGLLNNEHHDTTRIGGGIGDAIEQVADNIFNWWLQLYYVYYDVQHDARIMGKMKATEYVTLQSSDFDRRIVVSVAPDSMKPKDELTEINQAINLFQMGALDPKTLLTIMNVPDPQETAESTVLWLIDKNAYMQLNFPEVAQKMQQIQAEAMAQQNAQAQQQGQQQMDQQGAQGAQDLSMKQQSHDQKLQHSQQIHEQKLSQAPKEEKP